MSEQTVIVPPADVTVTCPLHGCDEYLTSVVATPTPGGWDLTVQPCGHDIPPSALLGLTWVIGAQIDANTNRRN